LFTSTIFNAADRIADLIGADDRNALPVAGAVVVHSNQPGPPIVLDGPEPPKPSSVTNSQRSSAATWPNGRHQPEVVRDLFRLVPLDPGRVSAQLRERRPLPGRSAVWGVMAGDPVAGLLMQVLCPIRVGLKISNAAIGVHHRVRGKPRHFRHLIGRMESAI
jgi:hypothetical protein